MKVRTICCKGGRTLLTVSGETEHENTLLELLMEKKLDGVIMNYIAGDTEPTIYYLEFSFVASGDKELK